MMMMHQYYHYPPKEKGIGGSSQLLYNTVLVLVFETIILATLHRRRGKVDSVIIIYYFCFFSILLCFVPRGVDLKKAPFFSSSSSTLSNRHDDRVRVNNSAKPLSSKKAERDKQVKSVHLDTVLLLGSFLGNKYTDLVQPTSNETKKPELIFVRYSAV